MPNPLRPDRRRVLQLAAGAAFASAFQPGRAAWAQAPRQGGTATLLLAAEPPVITTIAHTAYNAVYVSAKVTEGLLTYDFDLTPKPLLATEWAISADGLTYAFKLRRGVTWHDGQPFTAADVAYSLSAIKEVHPRGRSTFGNLVGIDTPDDHTVVLRLSKPAPYLISAFAAQETPIVPRYLYEGSKPDANPVNLAPVGTGPFRFKEWVRGSHILFERNPDYWDAPKPYLDGLVVRFIPDAGARAIALEAGEIDLAPNTPIPLNEIGRFETLPDIGFERNGYQYTNSVTRIEFNLERPFFQDLRVRQAFAHAIDRDLILQTVNYGVGQAIVGPISPNLSKWYVPDLRTYPLDLEKAEALLDEAGYRRGSDGVRIRLTHDYVPSADTFRRGADYIRQALAPIGVDVTVRSQDFATYTKRIYTDRDFDFAFEGMSNLFDPTVGVQRLFWSRNIRRGVPFSNGAAYSNPAVDALLEQAAVELDEVRRIEAWTKVQRIVVEDLPEIGIGTSPDLTIFNRRIAGHTVGAEGVAGSLASAHLTA